MNFPVHFYDEFSSDFLDLLVCMSLHLIEVCVNVKIV